MPEQPPFIYDLPPSQIAQRPCHPADSAKLLFVDRLNSELKISNFKKLPYFLRPNDLLVFNDSRVIPARLFGLRGELEVEFLLLNELGSGRWKSIGRPLRKLKINDRIQFSNSLSAIYLSRTKEDGALLEFYSNENLATREQVLEVGLMPIPPYIREGRSDSQDLIDYQTKFARVEGSIAAPTASLHFTENLISELRDSGCKISFLTLHVGLSSIREIESNKAPGAEIFKVSSKLIEDIANAKKLGGRVVAVGTTVVRALESYAQLGILEEDKETELFIKPGYQFQIVDTVVTNFHMPGSTHLLLVEAFMRDRELLSKSYGLALKSDFSFLSYGDGMIIV